MSRGFSIFLKFLRRFFIRYCGLLKINKILMKIPKNLFIFTTIYAILSVQEGKIPA